VAKRGRSSRPSPRDTDATIVDARPNARSNRFRKGPPAHIVERYGRPAQPSEARDLNRHRHARQIPSARRTAASVPAVRLRPPTSVPRIGRGLWRPGLPLDQASRPRRDTFGRWRAAALVLPLLITVLGALLAPPRPIDERMHAAIERLPGPSYPSGAPPIALAGELHLPPISLAAAAPEVPPVGSLTLPNLRLADAPPYVPPAGELTLPTLALASAAPHVTPPGSIALRAMTYPAVAPPTDLPGEMRLPDIRMSAIELHVLQPQPAAAAQQCRPLDVADSRTPLVSSAGIGDRIAAAALAQTSDLVVYNAAYRRIAFPGGDVSPLYGVCTDVVIRAYRALGVDLQALVQSARRGDPNIDHRRVEVLRRFLSRAGTSLLPSPDAEAYLPGDIVTYHRPQNRSSVTHIAIVTSIIAPSGRPMIVHNRGWGVQIEDALFVDRITGHYRYHPAPDAPGPIAAAATRPRHAVSSQHKPSPPLQSLRTAGTDHLRPASMR
jgi:uncharacterized protein YijF (DUF1287 family)